MIENDQSGKRGERTAPLAETPKRPDEVAPGGGDTDFPGEGGDRDYPGEGGDTYEPGRGGDTDLPGRGGDIDQPGESPDEVPPDIIQSPPD